MGKVEARRERRINVLLERLGGSESTFIFLPPGKASLSERRHHPLGFPLNHYFETQAMKTTHEDDTSSRNLDHKITFNGKGCDGMERLL